MQALDGITVLDLGTYIAGPFCATVLGEFGAEVIKVERPGTGDGGRRFGTETACGDTLVWLSEGRNKRSITVDLGTAAGQQILRDLIAVADVVIENFRPGTLERWNLSYEHLCEVNPGIVLTRVTGFGQVGLPGRRAGWSTRDAGFDVVGRLRHRALRSRRRAVGPAGSGDQWRGPGGRPGPVRIDLPHAR
jgi:crotonobetainyl-CoA:carnitine CoA-transferase CaiB-like acyl-CoA transferase